MNTKNNNTKIKQFFHEATSTFTYVVYSELSKIGVIIDPVLDYDHKSGKTSNKSAQNILEFCLQNSLQIDWILETHAHADHLSSAQFLKAKLGSDVCIGENIRTVQDAFSNIFNIKDITSENYYFDRLLKDGEKLLVGDLEIEVISTPGHTPACCSFKIGDNVFVGDTLFMPDVGSARCDFPGGNANTLYDSVQKIFSLGDNIRLFMCHDYPKDRDYQFMSTVKQQKDTNIHLKKFITKEMFVEMRTKRDATLEMPNLILPAIQFNIRAGGNLPKEDNDVAYIKIPIYLT
jgi:glyoxylase-like metal-dependent hydrolase (beta-lactamase superfamily II)